MNKEERDKLTALILYGMGHYKGHARGEEAYAEAEAAFTPAQMGALHRKMRVRAEELEYNDIMQGAY